MKNPLNVVAGIGLALGGVFGMIGTVVTQRNLQAASWGIDGVGLVVATALLAVKFFRSGNDVVAAGFLVFAIGEGVMLSGTATTLAGSVPFWRGHGIVVCGASAHRCSEGICRLGASGRRDRFNSFCDYGGKNLLGRAGTANLLAAALLRISLPRACIRRLDLDVAENSLKNHLRAHEICLTDESMSVIGMFQQLRA